jgi:hypothetical protein
MPKVLLQRIACPSEIPSKNRFRIRPLLAGVSAPLRFLI